METIYSEEVFILKILELNDKSVPAKLELLEALSARSSYLDPEAANELQRLRAGDGGEKVVVDYLKKFGRAHWTLLQNLWVEYFGTIECDGVLFVRGELYVIEVKNYSGLYEYNHGVSKLNNREISVNAIYQIQKAAMKVRELMKHRFPKIKVHGVLIFTGIDSQVDITPPIDDIYIVQRNELRAFIEKIAFEEAGHPQPAVDLEKVISHFKGFITKHPYPAEPLSSEDLMHIQKGILCANCASAEVEVTRKFIKCACGNIESREQGTLRTIRDYSILNFTKPLTTKDLLDFFNGQASETFLRRLLKTHFTRVASGRSTAYKNRMNV